MSRNRIVLLLGVAALLAFWFLKDEPKDDAEYLRTLPATIAGFAEKKQAPEIRRFVSESYSDERGRTYTDLNRIIVGHVLRAGEITIYTVNPEVELVKGEPLRANLKFHAAMTRGPRDPGAVNIIPDTATVYQFELKLEKSSDGWLVVSGDWGRLTTGQ